MVELNWLSLASSPSLSAPGIRENRCVYVWGRGEGRVSFQPVVKSRILPVMGFIKQFTVPTLEGVSDAKLLPKRNGLLNYIKLKLLGNVNYKYLKL